MPKHWKCPTGMLSNVSFLIYMKHFFFFLVLALTQSRMSTRSRVGCGNGPGASQAKQPLWSYKPALQHHSVYWGWQLAIATHFIIIQTGNSTEETTGDLILTAITDESLKFGPACCWPQLCPWPSRKWPIGKFPVSWMASSAPKNTMKSTFSALCSVAANVFQQEIFTHF